MDLGKPQLIAFSFPMFPMASRSRWLYARKAIRVFVASMKLIWSVLAQLSADSPTGQLAHSGRAVEFRTRIIEGIASLLAIRRALRYYVPSTH